MPSASRAVLVLRTVRHLRPSQIGWRAWYRLRPRPAPATGPAPPRRALDGWAVPVEKPASFHPRAKGDGGTGGRFEFLGVTREHPGDIDWHDAEPEKLWRYNLHYFDWLGSAAIVRDPAAGWAQVAHWIASNPPGRGEGWEPYPLSLRVVNWMKLALASGELPDEARTSLAVQVRWLRRHMERHIRANHLWENARALLFAGLFFGDGEGELWRRAGLAELERELAEQILADGAHYERSPMYHATLLEGLLDVLNLARAAARVEPGIVAPDVLDAWRGTLEAMLDWLGHLTHPDGEIAFFNDAAFGIAARPAALDAYASRLGLETPSPPTPGARDLAPSGHARLQTRAAVLLIDTAPVGPDHQPGHAHADTLSFELSHGGGRVLVNSGTSSYREGEQRSYERSTRAHNTVEVDGRDSSEVWATFRVARRARIVERGVSVRDGTLVAVGAHDGYRRLDPPTLHRREWRLDDERLVVTDTLDGDAHASIARFLVHPDLEAFEDGTIVAKGADDARRYRWETDGGRARVIEASWYPRFGERVACTAIEVVRTGRVGGFTLFTPTVPAASSPTRTHYNPRTPNRSAHNDSISSL